jgi:hypothetical protein
MVMIALCSSLIGAVLGTQYKVLVVFPATGIGVAVIVAVAALNGPTALATISALCAWVICMQLGYLGGLLTRYCLEATGLAPQRPLHSTIARN